MRYARNQERIYARCQVLEALGFEIEHEDSSVLVNLIGSSPSYVRVDFSAIAEEHFLTHAFTEVYKAGMEHGKGIIQEGIRNLIGIEVRESS